MEIDQPVPFLDIPGLITNFHIKTSDPTFFKKVCETIVHRHTGGKISTSFFPFHIGKKLKLTFINSSSLEFQGLDIAICKRGVYIVMSNRTESRYHFYHRFHEDFDQDNKLKFLVKWEMMSLAEVEERVKTLVTKFMTACFAIDHVFNYLDLALCKKTYSLKNVKLLNNKN